VPIVVTGQSVGTLHLEADAGRAWSEADEELAQAVAQQVAQQVEHLRLLADAERARAEAEQATRRLTREGWQDYGQAAELAAGYEYDLNQVRAVTSAEFAADDTVKLSRPLLVRGESVGELQVLPSEPLGEVEHDLVTAVASQLSAHIENLRLYAQAETSAQRAQTLIEHAPEASSRAPSARTWIFATFSSRCLGRR